MCEYGFPSAYPKQGNCSSCTATAYRRVPQYTQQQLDRHFVRYRCYPRQPYQIVPDLYTQPIDEPVQIPPQLLPQLLSTAQSAYQAGFNVTSNYGEPAAQWPAQASPENCLQSPAQIKSRSKNQFPVRSNSQTKAWTCSVPHCSSSAKFTRLADLQRHQATVHGMGTPDFPCNIQHCSRVGDKGFTRRDHLIEHLRNFHKVDVPKRKPGERSAFPFGLPEDIGERGFRKRSD